MEKKVFKFVQDVKSTIWRRYYFEVEAETEEEATRIATNYKDIDVCCGDDVLVYSSQIDLDTEEEMLPEENGGCSTICVYKKSDLNTPICKNGN